MAGRVRNGRRIHDAGAHVKVEFVTNICPHYRVKAFELFARLHETRFLFFSEGRSEKYWERSNATTPGNFIGGYLKGIYLPGTGLRFTPSLYTHLLRDDYDVLVKCINGKIPLLLSFLIARLRGIPFVLWTGLWHHPDTLMHRISFPLVRAIYRLSDAIVVYGSHVEQYLVEMGVSREKIFIAWQAVDNALLSRHVDDTAVAELRAELGAEEKKVILYVGRLEDQKGVEYLLEAVREIGKKLPVVVVIIGTGSKAGAFQQVVGPDLTRFRGYVSNETLPIYYKLADVLVLPSITTKDFKEPWGLVINEAMNQGCPVIATNAVGAAKGGLVQDGVTGLVVPERDSAAIARALDTILRNDDIRRQMRAKASEEIKLWTYERMVHGFDEAVKYAQSKKGGST
ncbi:MAG: glycosyltransferase family 4 protein [Bacteroidota bacterium]